VTAAKRFSLEQLLEAEPSVYVVVDQAVAGVRLPATLPPPEGSKLYTVLVLGLALPVPIYDLSITNDGWSATLSFSRRPFKVSVPWGAVCGYVAGSTGRGVVFNEAGMREAGFEKQETPAQQREASTVEEKRKTLPPGWRVVDGGKGSGSTAA
jgi:stringent starvation protein B